jgi:hypothetical protein
LLHDEFIREFLETFPEFRPSAEEEFYCWKGRQPPLYIFFISVLDPFLVSELESMRNSVLLFRIFEYLEKLCNSDVAGVREALISTLTWLGNYEGLLDKSRNFMGPKMLKLSLEVETVWTQKSRV